MNSPRVALVVPNPRRDLLGLALVAFELCQRGITCYLVPINFERRELWALEPDAVLLYHARRSNSEFVTQLTRAAIQCGLLDAEGGVWAHPADYAELLWDDKALLESLSYVCVWGPALADYLAAHKCFMPRQLHVTGHPRFDFYEPHWRSVLESAPENNNGGRPRLLVNTLFSEVNQRGATLAGNMKYFRDIYGWSAARVETHFATQQRALGQTVEMIKNLERDYAECQVVLRPHPLERYEFYREEFGPASTVEINASESVQEQIFRAAAVIQRSCTTGIEAGMAHVPTLSPQWIEAAYPQPLAESVSVPSANYGEMRRQLEAILDGEFEVSAEIKANLDEVVRRWFRAIDGLAYKRVSDTIANNLPARRLVSSAMCRRNLYAAAGSWRRGKRTVRERVRASLGLPPQWSFRRFRVDPDENGWLQATTYFDPAGVGNLVSTIERGMRCQGIDVARVSVARADEAGHYSKGYKGHAVVLSRA